MIAAGRAGHWVALFAVAAVGVGAQFGAAAMHLGVLITVVAVLYRRAFRAPAVIWWAVLAVIASALLHGLIGREPLHLSYATFPRYLLLLPLVAALVQRTPAATVERALAAVALIACLSALYGAVQVTYRTPGFLIDWHPGKAGLTWNHRSSTDLLTFAPEGLRATGMVHHVLAFAHIGCMVSLAGLSLAVFGTRTKARIAWSVVAIAGVGSVVLSGGRAGLLGWLIGALLIGAVRVLGARTRWRAAVVGLGLLGGVLAGGLTVFSAQTRGAVGNTSGRQAIWGQAQTAVAETFPRGLGYGAYPGYAARVYPQSGALKAKVKAWAHNTWLSLLAEAPLALFAWLFLIGTLIKLFFEAVDDAPALAALGLASVVAWVAISMFHDSHFQRVYAPFMFWLWGLCLGGILRRTDAPQVGASSRS
jgi:hypothetical protein